MEYAESTVRELMAEVARELGLTGPVKVRPLSSAGGNYTSALFSASIQDIKIFAKVAIVGDKMREVMATVFRTEQLVYSKLVKTYTNLQKNHEGAALFRFPKVFALLPEVGRESVLMEDLTSQGYRTPSRKDPIDWRFATAAVSKMASFHALSFAYQKEDPVAFSEISERLKHVGNKERSEELKAAWEKMVRGGIQVAREQHRSKLVKLLANGGIFDKFRTPISRVVLTHGDYRPSNLMFKEQDGKLDIMVVDFQTVHSGCPVSDLLYFIFLGTDQHFRRLHYQNLIHHYHRELSAALDSFGVDVEEVYPREVFEDEIIKMVPLTLGVSVVLLPIVMVDEEAAPQTAGDADISQFALKPNELFAERFSTLVDDCVEWGAL